MQEKPQHDKRKCPCFSICEPIGLAIQIATSLSILEIKEHFQIMTIPASCFLKGGVDYWKYCK
jgi:hypothetical protein